MGSPLEEVAKKRHTEFLAAVDYMKDCLIKQYGIPIGSLLGCGSIKYGTGCVYEAGHNLVVKFTRDLREAELSQYLIEYPDIHPSMPRVYYVWLLTAEHMGHVYPDYYAILREDLTDMEVSHGEWMNAALEELENNLPIEFLQGKRAVNWSNLSRALQPPDLYIVEDWTEKFNEREKDYLLQIAELYVWLAKNRIVLCDLHLGNWGMRGKRVVARDIGCILNDPREKNAPFREPPKMICGLRLAE